MLCLALLCGCTAPAQKTELTTLRIGICLYRKDDTFLSYMVESMNREAKLLEQQYDIKLILTFKDGQNSQATQTEQVFSLLDRSYDALLVNVVDRTAVAAMVDRARAADIPLLFFNREPVEEDLARWDRLCYVGADAAESGRLQAELLIEQWNTQREKLDKNGDGKLQYVMLEGDAGHQDSLIRTKSVITALGEAGIVTDKLATGIANWARVQGMTKTALWQEQFGSGIEAIISNNDDMALGAIDALSAAGVRPLPAIVGIDGTPQGLDAVRQGQLLGTVYNDGEGQAGTAIEAAVALALGKPLPSEYRAGQYYRLPYQLVTPQTLDAFVKPQE